MNSKLATYDMTHLQDHIFLNINQMMNPGGRISCSVEHKELLEEF